MNDKIKPNKRPFFRFVKSIMRIFKRKPRFTYLGKKPQGACIYISNHYAASGPTTYELYLPCNFRIWGTYEMCGGFKSRWKYLRYIYFRQKKKRSRFTSFVLATIVAPFMALFYKGMRIIPTYPDSRLMSTIKTSVEELKNGTSILIFPENSSDGYHEVLTEFYGGFYTLAKRYYDVTGNDIDIVGMYYDKKTNNVIVSEPKSYCKLAAEFQNREDVVDFFLTQTNNMFYEHIKPLRKNRRNKNSRSQ